MGSCLTGKGAHPNAKGSRRNFLLVRELFSRLGETALLMKFSTRVTVVRDGSDDRGRGRGRGCGKPGQPSNGKWILIQQDFEWDFGLGRFGGEQGLAPWRTDVSLYIGSFRDQAIGKTCELPAGTSGCNALGFSRVKDLFIQNFKAKFDDTMKALAKDVLSRDNVLKVVEAGVKEFKKEDWDASPASKVFCGADRKQTCNVDAVHEGMVKWTNERAAVVSQRLP